ncbi:MAG: right-handed parallel beta-helix repeat-containing protein [Bacteroidota bacterium]
MKNLPHLALLLVLLSTARMSHAQPVEPIYTRPNFEETVGLDVPRPTNVICHQFFDVVDSHSDIDPVPTIGGRFQISDQIELAAEKVGLAVAHATDLHVLYFPEGNYQINQQQNIGPNNIVIRGAGSNKTIFHWVNTSDQFCFNVLGPNLNTATEYSLTKASPGGNKIYAASATSVPNGTLLLLTRDDPLASCDATFTRQWVRKISASPSKGLIRSDGPIRIKYNSTVNGRLYKLAPSQFIGFECFRVDASQNSSLGRSSMTANIHFEGAVNCWVEGVESVKAAVNHLLITKSSNVEVRGCYFRDGHVFSGGKGYGIDVQDGSGECLIENNIFKDLRHSIVLERGANGNAIVYNYSENYRGADSRSDMTIHGNYPFHNLIEGNSFARIHFDRRGSCENGPYNIVFRNEVRQKNILSGDFPNLSAIEGPNAVIANESEKCINLYGSSSFHKSYDNIEYGIFCIGNHGDNGDPTPNETSLLYATRPAFLNSNSFPTFGPGSASNSVLPAEQRASYSLKTVGGNCSQCRPTQPLDVSAQVINCFTNGMNTIPGFIYLNITGGQAPYSTSWGLFVYSTTTTSAQFNNPTLWSATVTDNNGQSVLVSGFTGPCSDGDIFKTAESDNGSGEEPSALESMALRAAPNPFRAATRLNLDLPERRDVTVDLYAIDGTLIRQIHRGSLNRGPHRLEISGTGLAPGLYFCRVRAGEERQVIRLVVQ